MFNVVSLTVTSIDYRQLQS